MTCNHKRTYWTTVEDVNDWTGETTKRSKLMIVSTYKDLGLHSYMCTQCKEVGYYSSRAEKYAKGDRSLDVVNGLGLKG